ncbi:MAG: indolepyruvate oxidoreductase subunit beta [Oscillospiraceae bacterium]|nr:indolepyruvate oxidoreductase subunit beta [Oscillospiraceae bacterium]
MSAVTSIIIAGVGGQGTIVAGKLLGDAALRKGLDVKVSEVHGMAQRGGSVVTYVRYGEKVYSPMTEAGGADFLIAFEELEAARWLWLLKKGGVAVIDSHRIAPASVTAGTSEYPTDISERLSEFDIELYRVDAFALAKEAGFIKAANVALMGAFAAVSDLGYETCAKSIESVLPGRFLAENIKAFKSGYDSARRI